MVSEAVLTKKVLKDKRAAKGCRSFINCVFVYNMKSLRRWRSGQTHLTVNQATYVYGGSNPSLRTEKDEWRRKPLFVFVGQRFYPVPTLLFLAEVLVRRFLAQ